MRSDKPTEFWYIRGLIGGQLLKEGRREEAKEIHRIGSNFDVEGMKHYPEQVARLRV